MKFYCDNCQTKYSIADEKVRGKVLKVRCKRCNHVVTVSGSQSPSKSTAQKKPSSNRNAGAGRSRQTGGGPASPPPTPKTPQWHYSVEGQSFGPVDQQVLEQKFAAGELGEGAFVWNETFTDWKPAKQVAVFAQASAKAAPPEPPAVPKPEKTSPAKQRQSRSPKQRRDRPSKGSSAQRRRPQQDKQSTAAKSQPDDRRDVQNRSPGKTDDRRQPGAQKADSSGVNAPQPGGEVDDEELDETVLHDDLPEAVKALREENQKSAAPSGESRGERLEKLRNRLKLDESKPEQEAAKPQAQASAEEPDPTVSIDPKSDPDVPDWVKDEVGGDRSPEDDSVAGAPTEQAGSEVAQSQQEPVEPAADEVDSPDFGLDGLFGDEGTTTPAEHQQAPTDGDVDRRELQRDDAGPGDTERPLDEFAPADDGGPAEADQGDIAHAETLLDGADNSQQQQPQSQSRGPAAFDGAERQAPTPESASEPLDPLNAAGGTRHDGLFSTGGGLAEGDGGPQGPEIPPASGLDADSSAGVDDEPDDAVPFFPSAPKLGESEDETEQSTSMSRVDEMTGSLLIQINEIKSSGRKQAITAAVVALCGLVAIAAVVTVGWSQLGVDDDIEEDDGVRMDHVGGEPVFHEYTEEELARVSDRLVLEEEMVISREDGKAAYEREEQRARGERAEQPSNMPSVNPESLRRDRGEDAPAAERGPEEEAGPSQPRFARPDFQSSGADQGEEGLAEMGGADDEERGEMDDRFEAMAALQADTQRGVHGADDDPNVGLEMQEGLMQTDIARGIEAVMESVGACRERHIYRGGTLEEDQLRVSLTVVPKGEVGRFTMKPATLEDTDFGRCMNSHTGRWRFPRFKGDPVEIEAPFALQ